ncbi:hypothetical protein [Roseisolibacter agri]|uniref:hypothetical protein n=1 Tax=Roseisolibacter agri TaxID=2014610 RepID=UPI0024E191BB|nr:hypothetical protein [Roseisolibacter agri]
MRRPVPPTLLLATAAACRSAGGRPAPPAPRATLEAREARVAALVDAGMERDR